MFILRLKIHRATPTRGYLTIALGRRIHPPSLLLTTVHLHRHYCKCILVCNIYIYISNFFLFSDSFSINYAMYVCIFWPHLCNVLILLHVTNNKSNYTWSPLVHKWLWVYWLTSLILTESNPNCGIYLLQYITLHSTILNTENDNTLSL